MAIRVPEEEELRQRILTHLNARPGNPLVTGVWRCYLAGLIEWGVINPDFHKRLDDLLPKDGALEMVEIMLGYEYVDEHPEIATEITSGSSTTPVRIDQ